MRSPDYTLLLKNHMRTYKLETITETLLRKNRRILTGGLYPAQIKYYSKEDKTRAGGSKEGWRLIVFKADKKMIRALEKVDEHHHFQLGSNGVQLRGGPRKKQAWNTERSSQQHRPPHQHQHPQHQQQRKVAGDYRSRSFAEENTRLSLIHI